MTIYVFGETVANRQVFDPTQIEIPQVPVELIVAFHNNDTAMSHSFSMDDVNTTRQVDTGILDPGQNATVNFTVLSVTRILHNGTQFTAETDAIGIVFYCIPHRGAGMIGHIVLASVAAPAQEKGILLRAYWIGIIGIAATLVWVGISYFVIKTSSRRFRDHREHVRKGLP